MYGHQQYDKLQWLNTILYQNGYTPFNIYPLGLTGLSVFGIFFVSGAVLAYNYKAITDATGYISFAIKRLFRIYPAFWMSLMVGLMVSPLIFNTGAFDILFEFTGFYVLLGKGIGSINIMGWFVAAIVCLYLLFPLISAAVTRYQLKAVLLFMMISFVSRYLLITYPISNISIPFMWLPICTIFEFSLGIYIIQRNLFPKTQSPKIISKLSDLTFYVFLIHIIIIGLFKILMNNGRVFDTISSDLNVSYFVYYIYMIITIILCSIVIMKMDNKFQTEIRSVKFIQKLIGIQNK